MESDIWLGNVYYAKLASQQERNALTSNISPNFVAFAQYVKDTQFATKIIPHSEKTTPMLIP